MRLTAIFVVVSALIMATSVAAMAATVVPSIVTKILSAIALFVLIPLSDPLLLHEIHLLAASVVAVTMFFPILPMPWWHIKINRLVLHRHRLPHNDHRLRSHQHRLRVIADIDSAINARLMNTNRDPY